MLDAHVSVSSSGIFPDVETVTCDVRPLQSRPATPCLWPQRWPVLWRVRQFPNVVAKYENLVVFTIFAEMSQEACVCADWLCVGSIPNRGHREWARLSGHIVTYSNRPGLGADVFQAIVTDSVIGTMEIRLLNGTSALMMRIRLCQVPTGKGRKVSVLRIVSFEYCAAPLTYSGNGSGVPAGCAGGCVVAEAHARKAGGFRWCLRSLQCGTGAKMGGGP